MQVLDTIKQRRAVRFYTDKPIEENKLRQLIEAALWAPTGGNIQAWNAVIVQREKDIELVKAVSPGMLGNANALIILCTDRKKGLEKIGEMASVTSLIEIGIIAQNICLEAMELGLGSCMIKSFNQNAVRELFELPEHIIPELVVSLGYPRSVPKPPPRRTIEETVILWIKEKSTDGR